MSKMRDARLNSRLTVAELSAQSGVSMTTIYTYERGALKPYWSTLCKLATALGCSPHDIDDHAEGRENLLVCVVCGVEVQNNPTDTIRTCRDPECIKQHRLNVSRSPAVTKSIIEGNKAFRQTPAGQPGVEFYGAKHWEIQAPDGTVYKCRNLMHWLRENECLLDGTIRQAWDGITKIKYSMQGKRKNKSHQWKGWRLIDWGDY